MTRVIVLRENEHAVGLLTYAKAAKFLSVSENHFRNHVLPTVSIVEIGQRRLVAVEELLDWIDRRKRPPVEAVETSGVSRRVRARAERLMARAKSHQ